MNVDTEENMAAVNISEQEIKNYQFIDGYSKWVLDRPLGGNFYIKVLGYSLCKT